MYLVQYQDLSVTIILHTPSPIHTGVKFIPMRTSGGELIPEAGLFVKIKKTEQSFHFNTATSTTGRDVGLETISEDVDVEASLNPISLMKYLPRQEDAQYEVDPEESLLRRTVSSPPSLTVPEASEARRKSSENKFEVNTNTVKQLHNNIMIVGLQ